MLRPKPEVHLVLELPVKSHIGQSLWPMCDVLEMNSIYVTGRPLPEVPETPLPMFNMFKQDCSVGGAAVDSSVMTTCTW